MVLIPRNAPKASFGVRGPDPPANDTPGPGHYTGLNAKSPGLFPRSGAAVFGTCPRSNRTREGPGPGQYKVLDRRKGPSFSCSPRRQRAFNEDSVQEYELGPGPGAYDDALSFTASGPSYSMASTFSDKAYNGPGPGHYSDAGKPRRPRGGFGFGTSRREPGNVFKTPGPGQYTTNSTLGGPGFSLTPRRQTNRTLDNGVPGPGAHDHHPDFSEDTPWTST